MSNFECSRNTPSLAALKFFALHLTLCTLTFLNKFILTTGYIIQQLILAIFGIGIELFLYKTYGYIIHPFGTLFPTVSFVSQGTTEFDKGSIFPILKGRIAPFHANPPVPLFCPLPPLHCPVSQEHLHA